MAQYHEVREHVIFQNNSREAWKDEDAHDIAVYLKEEVEELIEALQLAQIGAGVYEVASELGDVMYLLFKLSDLLGIDLLDACQMKTMRNAKKYDDHILNNGFNPDEAREVSKKIWEQMNGEEMFSIAFLELFGQD